MALPANTSDRMLQKVGAIRTTVRELKPICLIVVSEPDLLLGQTSKMTQISYRVVMIHMQVSAASCAAPAELEGAVMT